MEFTGLVKKFEKLDAVVLGISPDPVERQKKFEQKHDLKVTLLSDEDKAVTTKYGIYGDKKMYGNLLKGIKRTTMLIDPKGKIVKIWNNVRVKEHADKVLEAAKEFASD